MQSLEYLGASLVLRCAVASELITERADGRSELVAGADVTLEWPQQAGLNPDKAPATWAEMADYAKTLTKKDSGKVTQYGAQIPSSGFPYWLFQALVIQNDVAMVNDSDPGLAGRAERSRPAVAQLQIDLLYIQ